MTAKQEQTNACCVGETLALPEWSGVIPSAGAEMLADPGTAELMETEGPTGSLESVVRLPVLLDSRGATVGTGTELLVDPGVTDPMEMEGASEGAVELPVPLKEFEALVDIDGEPQIVEKKRGAKLGKVWE